MALTTIPSELSSVSGISDSSTSTAITINSSQEVTFAGNITTGSNTISGVLSSVTGSLGSAATATTQAASDNTTKIATTAYVTTALANMVDSAPSTLDTLNELAAALGDDANFSTTVTNSIATKLPLAGGTMTGNIAHASDFTIDAGGAIKLDADSSNIYLSDGGTDIGLLSTNNQDLNIRNLITDKDIYFQGNDGGSTITALTLDMSAAGFATFNDGATFSPNSGTLDIKVGTHDATNNVRLNAGGTTSTYLEYRGYLGHIFDVNTTRMMTLTSTGLGIGVDSPSAPLHIDSGTTTDILRFGAGGRWGFQRANSDSRYVSFSRAMNGTAQAVFTVDGDNGNVGIGAAPNTTGFGGTFKYLGVNGGSGLGTFNGQTSSVTANQEAAAFFGSTTGSSGLALLGGMQVINDANSASNAEGAVRFYTATGGSILERMRIDRSGNVAIGTASGYDGLNVYRSSNTAFRLHNSTTGVSTSAGFVIQQAGDESYVWNYEPSNLIFGTDNTSQVIINRFGSLSIKTSSPIHYTGYAALDFGLTGTMYSNTSGTNITSLLNNAYLNSNASAWVYKQADEASYLAMMDGKFRFFTAAAGSAGGSITWGDEKMVIDNAGNVGIGTTTPDQLLEVAGGNVYVGTETSTANFTDSNSGATNFIEIGSNGGGGGDALFVAHAAGKGVGYFGYEAGNDRLIIACDNGGAANTIEFSVNAGTTTGGGTDNLAAASPAVTIDGQGNMLTAGLTSVNGVGGTTLHHEGYIWTSRNNGTPVYVNRSGSSGELIHFHKNNASIGEIRENGAGVVSYLGFTGVHETSGPADDLLIGTVISTIDELDTKEMSDEDGNISVQSVPYHPKAKVSDTAGDKRVYGVLSEYHNKTGKPIIGSVGVGQVLVTGACEGGDLLESNGDGTAKVQDDDIIRSKTIGKVTISDSTTAASLVACVLYCG